MDRLIIIIKMQIKLIEVISHYIRINITGQ